MIQNTKICSFFQTFENNLTSVIMFFVGLAKGQPLPGQILSFGVILLQLSFLVSPALRAN